MNKPLYLAALMAAAISAPAFAQDQVTATLRVDSGSAMISQGGEFTPAASGSQVPSGSRVMLAEGSRATLVYPNGCSQALSTAGVFSVPATCVAAAGTNGGATAGGGTAAGVDLAAVGIIGGSVAAIAGIAEATMDDQPAPPPPPISR